MSGKNLGRYYLEYDQTVNYFKEHINSGRILSQIVLSEIDFKNGKFFTFLPNNAFLERIYNFEIGIIPVIPIQEEHPNEDLKNFNNGVVLTTIDECSSAILDFLNFQRENCCNVENYMLSRDSNFTQFGNVFTGFYNENDVCFYLKSENSLEEIKHVIRRSSEIWFSLIVLSSSKQAPENKFSEGFLIDLCKNIKFIITGAYDGDSYIIWESLGH